MERVFLGFERPALVSVASYLVEKATDSARSIDLSDFLVVVPVASAGRRLEEILVQQAQAHARPLVPPAIVTTGALAERLYRSEKEPADDATSKLAWAAAVRATPRDRLLPFFPQLPDDGDVVGWMALSDVVERLHVELAAECLDFIEVSRRGARVSTFDEADRWMLMADIQKRWLRTLDDLGMCDKHTARQRAIEQSSCSTDKRIVLVATVDLNQTQRSMIDQVADRVTAVIFAPSAWADRFDQHGCVVCKAWCELPIDLADEQIEQADDPGAQADALVRAIARWDGRFAAAEITVGIVDERLTSVIEQRLNECSVYARYGGGVSLARTPPLRLLSAVADFLDGQRYTDLAALVRHPAVAAWLDKKVPGDWLTTLDKYFANHLPRQFDGTWFAEGHQAVTMRKLYSAVRELLAQLIDVQRLWPEWGQPIADLLVTVFGGAKLDPQREADRQVVEACDAIAECLRQHQQMSVKLAPRLSGGQAIALTLRALSSAKMPPRADPQAVEMLGWLELVLDDAPGLVLTGFNEELVPSCRNGDLFLPNDLRRALGVDDNDRCLARDAYALAAIAASRQKLHVIFGRRTAEGDPLTPSRLLFATDDSTLARRACKWFSNPQSSPRLLLPATLRPGDDLQADFPIPRPKPLATPIKTMSVSSFRDYLACPYRFYLRHCCKLEAIDDMAEELDDGQFGWLIHKVVEVFGKSEVAASQSPEEIEAVLAAKLEAVVSARYGKYPLAAVIVQIEQARQRLRSFARWQAEWATQGWRIRYAEEDLKQIVDKVSLTVDGEKMGLCGRLDRIDFNELTGEWALLDYKTGDAGNGPDKTHLRRGEWIDLQLPLYRHFIEPLHLAGPGAKVAVKLGYITIPKTLSQVQVQFADWSEEELTSADERAYDVVRAVRAERFWPPAEAPPAFSEDLAPICQDDQFGVAIAAQQKAEVGA